MPIALGDSGARRAATDGKGVPEEIANAWASYKRNGCTTARNRLVSYYMDRHVRPIAARIHAGLPGRVELDDLIQQGYLGLVDAMDRFKLDRDTRFETFSRRRIAGAIQDYLRAIDPVPRLTRSRAKRIQAAGEQFRMEHGRPPSEDELVPLLGLPREAVERFLARPAPLSTITFSGAHPDGTTSGEGDGDAMDGFASGVEPNPLGTAERGDLQRWLTRGFELQDRLIIVLYYYERLTMREIGRTVGISESRVSQRLESILDRLRARLSREAEQEFV